MSSKIPCLSSRTAGSEDPRLRQLLADGIEAAGRDFSGELLSLYDHDTFLLVTWRDAETRSQWSKLFTRLWSERTDGAPYLHLICSDEDYGYDEDDLDHGANL